MLQLESSSRGFHFDAQTIKAIVRKSSKAGQSVREALNSFGKVRDDTYAGTGGTSVPGFLTTNEPFNITWFEADLAFAEKRIGPCIRRGKYHQTLQHHIQDALSPEESVRILNRSLQDMVPVESPVLDFFDRSAHIDRFEQRMPTGVDLLDKHLSGGLGLGLGVIQGAISAGKSMLLSNIAAHAAFTLGKSVLYVTLELSAAKTLRRIDGYLFDHEINSIPALLISEDKWRERAEELAASGGRLHIIEYPANTIGTETLRSAIGKIHTLTGQPPDLLVVDYLGLLRGDREPGASRYGEMRDIASEVRAMSNSMKMHSWTACQSVRGAGDKSLSGLDDIADSIEVPRIADTVVTINQTASERSMTPPRARLVITKDRDGGGRGAEVVCVTDLPKGRVVASSSDNTEAFSSHQGENFRDLMQKGTG